MPWRSNKPHSAITFILVMMLVDGIGLGLIMPVIPPLLVELSDGNVSRAAIYGGWLTGLCSLVQFFSAPLLGNLSDRFGRRPVLIRSLAAFGLYYLALGLAPSISWLTLGMIVAGIFGATMSAANAYVADVTEPDHRAQRFGMIAAAMGTGLAIGPVLVGLLDGYGTRTPFFVAASLALLNVLYGSIALPESLREENRRPFSLARSNPLSLLLKMRKHASIVPLLAALSLVQVLGMTVLVTWGYFTIFQFGWSQGDIGWSLGFSSVATILVQSLFVGRVNRRLGSFRTAYLGFGCLIVALLGYAFASESWLMLVFIVPWAFGSMTTPALICQMVNRVPPSSQGELQGAVASIGGLAGTLTPPLMTSLFGWFSADDALIHFSGAPYFLSALLGSVGLFITWHASRPDGDLPVQSSTHSALTR